MKWGLTDAVGLTNEGTQCRNLASDQQQVAELLDAAGLPAGGRPLDELPPIGDGLASVELCDSIRGFQEVQGLIADARVDIGGATWQRLIELVDPGNAPPGGVPVLLVVSDFEVLELPQSASGLPSLTYTVRGPVAFIQGPGIRVELSVNGPFKVSWGDAFPLACQVAPDIKALEQAVASGLARNIGGVALDSLCTRIKAESRAAVAGLFAGISLRVGVDGTPIIGGTIGDDQEFQTIAFDAAEGALIYTATRRVLVPQSVTGGEAQVSGDIQLELKVIGTGGDEASIAAALAVAVGLGFVVLAPVAEWAVSSAAAGLGQGVRQILVRLGALAFE